MRREQGFGNVRAIPWKNLTIKAIGNGHAKTMTYKSFVQTCSTYFKTSKDRPKNE